MILDPKSEEWPPDGADGPEATVDVFAGGRKAPPFPVFPELTLDLDLELLAAIDNGDDEARAGALAAANIEILWRISDLAEPWVDIAGAPTTADALAKEVEEFVSAGEPAIGQWLHDIVAAWASAWCDGLGVALRMVAEATAAEACGVGEAVAAAVRLLNASADAFAVADFGPIPVRADNEFNAQLWLAAVRVFFASYQRVSLRVQLDGAGGLAGTPEFNPFAAAILNFDQAVYRRLYRLFYGLLEHVGFFDDEAERQGHYTPDEIDHMPY